MTAAAAPARSSLTSSLDGQWVAIHRGYDISLLAGGAGPAAAQVDIGSEDADVTFVGSPTMLAVVARNVAPRVMLYAPPNLEVVGRHDLDLPMRIGAVTGSRIALVSADGKKLVIVRVAAGALAAQTIDLDSPLEFIVGLDKHQLLLGLQRKLEVWDATTGRPLLRMQLQLPPPPRTVGAAQGHIWVTRPNADDVIVYRLSDGRPFRHLVGAPPLEIAASPATPIIIVGTARHLIRLHCFAHSLTVIDAPWTPGIPLAQLALGDDVSLLGLAPGQPEPWRVPIAGAGAPAIPSAPAESEVEPPSPPATNPGAEPVVRFRSIREKQEAERAAAQAAAAAIAGDAGDAHGTPGGSGTAHGTATRTQGPSLSAPGGSPSTYASTTPGARGPHGAGEAAYGGASSTHGASISAPSAHGTGGTAHGGGASLSAPGAHGTPGPGTHGTAGAEHGGAAPRLATPAHGVPATYAPRFATPAHGVPVVAGAAHATPAHGAHKDWRDAFAALGAELVRGGTPDLAVRLDDTAVAQLADRLLLAPRSIRALVALYAVYLVGEPELAIADLAHLLGDWAEPLGRGELAAFAMLRRKRGRVSLRAAVTDLLDGAPPRAVRIVSHQGQHAIGRPRSGAWRFAREGKSDAELEALLAGMYGRIAVIEGSPDRGILEARLHGATAVAFQPPPHRPQPWPRDAGLVLVLYGNASSWIADLPNLET